jgi:F-box-like
MANTDLAQRTDPPCQPPDLAEEQSAVATCSSCADDLLCALCCEARETISQQRPSVDEQPAISHSSQFQVDVLAPSTVPSRKNTEEGRRGIESSSSGSNSNRRSTNEPAVREDLASGSAVAKGDVFRPSDANLMAMAAVAKSAAASTELVPTSTAAAAHASTDGGGSLSSLPEAVLLHIFSFLDDAHDVCRVAKVSRRFRRIASSVGPLLVELS